LRRDQAGKRARCERETIDWEPVIKKGDQVRGCLATVLGAGTLGCICAAEGMPWGALACGFFCGLYSTLTMVVATEASETK
jgi:hypothetical protein